MRVDVPEGPGRPGGRTAGAVAVAAALVVLFAAAVALAGPETGAADKVGRAAPAFALRTLQGDAMDSKAAVEQKRPVLLNFWGIRCQSCLEELPYLAALHETYGRAVSFYGINVDGIDGDFLRQQMDKGGVRIPYGIVADPEMKLLDLFEMTAAPLTILVGPEGTIRYVHEGFAAGDEEPLTRAIRDVVSAR